MESNSAVASLLQAVRYFADPDHAVAFMVEVRWPNGVTCPTCGGKDVAYLKSRRLWNCRADHPRRQFSIKVGTIFEDSPIGLDKWLPAMWMIVNCKNGISSYELARGLKVTQKSAWFMLHRIRLAMQTSGGKLGGFGSTVEVDETYIGGKARWMNAKRRAKAKTGKKPGPHSHTRALVLGMLERGGKVRTAVVGGNRRNQLLPHVVKNVARGTMVHTDELRSYDGLVYQEHQVVNHTETYVKGNVHVNGIESFWALLKRGIRGTYVSVEPFHLFRYLDEQAFRFNERKGNDRSRFVQVLGAIVGRRLTYNELIGLDASLATT